MKKRLIKLIVNILTLTRVVGSFCLPIVITKFSALTSIIFLSLLFITDALDGLLARRFKVCTKGGFHLDQFCDKILGLSVLLAFLNKQKWLLLPIILEFSIGTVNVIRASIGETGSSSLRGKVKTIIFSIALVLAGINVMDATLLNTLINKLPSIFNVLKSIDFTINNNVVKIAILFTAVFEIATLIGYIKEALNEIRHPSDKLKTNEKITSFHDIKIIIQRLWNEEVFLSDRDKSIQQVIQEELISIHNIRK